MSSKNSGASAPPFVNSKGDLEKENRQLRARVAELERLVVTDTLTPLFNRRYFMEELERWCWRTRRYGGDYGLLFIDVDNMKAVNDQHGHAVGDALLVAIAKSLMVTARRSDIVARIGGDEFAVLLDNIPENEILLKRERLAGAVAKLVIDHNGIQLKPTVSVGYTVLEPGIKPAELLLRADRSMYAFKQAKAL